MSISRGLDYWLRNFPEFRKEIMEKDQLAQTAQTQINQLALDNAVKEEQIAKLTKQNAELQKQIKNSNLNLEKEKNKMVSVKLSDKEIWQNWHDFIDETQTGYHEPLTGSSSTNIEMRYGTYTSNSALIKHFREKIAEKLAIDKTYDERFDHQDQVEEILRQIVFSKL